MKLKETLNLGKTDFPMRAGLPTKEPVWQKEWEEAKLYQRRQELNQGKPHFTLHDGPPYANGNIHVGHAITRFLKILLFVLSLCLDFMLLISQVGILMVCQSSKSWQNRALNAKKWTWLST